MGRDRLSPEERQRRMREGRCLYCGELRHLIATCPVRTTWVPRRTTPSTPTARVLTSVQVKHHTVTISMEALIDSGADESLLDWGLAKKLGLETKILERPVKASSLNGHELFTITRVTKPVSLIMGEHTELLTFYLCRSNTRTLVLGYPCLMKHNPRIDWPMGWVKEWGRECDGRCLREKTPTPASSMFNVVSAHPITDSQYPDLTTVPSCYHHIKEVFNKTKATSLPTHRPCDCAIETSARCHNSQGVAVLHVWS